MICQVCFVLDGLASVLAYRNAKFFQSRRKFIFVGPDKIYQGNAISLPDIIRDGNAAVTRTSVSVKLPGLLYAKVLIPNIVWD